MMIETLAGPAVVFRWPPGVRPGWTARPRSNASAGLLGAALADVPLADALRAGAPTRARFGEYDTSMDCGGQAPLLTGHGHVLVEIARNPEGRIRDISQSRHPAQEGLNVGPFLALLAASENERATPEPDDT